jgi:Fe-S-cluster containining protein
MIDDGALIQIVDAALSRVDRRGINCKPGCSHCCIGPFVVTQRDLERLRRANANPAIFERAAEARQRMREEFPGDWETGIATQPQDAFDERHKWLPCPVLDLESGACQLYDHRPLACRFHGPALRVDGADVKPCRLNSPVATPIEIELPPCNQPNELTYIAWAFTCPTEARDRKGAPMARRGPRKTMKVSATPPQPEPPIPSRDRKGAVASPTRYADFQRSGRFPNPIR